MGQHRRFERSADGNQNDCGCGAARVACGLASWLASLHSFGRGLYKVLTEGGESSTRGPKITCSAAQARAHRSWAKGRGLRVVG
jgi:hypothetical protein